MLCIPCRIDKESLTRVEKRRIEGKYLIKAIPFYISENTIGLSQYLDYMVNMNEELKLEEQKTYQNKLKYGDGFSGEYIHCYIKACCQ